MDTVLTVPGLGGVAAVMVALDLDVPDPDLAEVEALLEPAMVAALSDALDVAEAPAPAADHVRHALSHLAVGELRNAWPPLVIGVEGLFWAEAVEEGHLDAHDRFTDRQHAWASTARSRATRSTLSWRCQ